VSPVVDHRVWAEGYRIRAARCQSVAKQTSSTSIGKCYELLADHYGLLAKLEEDYAAREMEMIRQGLIALPA
jgi:hypothetical protein